MVEVMLLKPPRQEEVTTPHFVHSNRPREIAMAPEFLPEYCFASQNQKEQYKILIIDEDWGLLLCCGGVEWSGSGGRDGRRTSLRALLFFGLGTAPRHWPGISVLPHSSAALGGGRHARSGGKFPPGTAPAGQVGQVFKRWFHGYSGGGECANVDHVRLGPAQHRVICPGLVPEPEVSPFSKPLIIFPSPPTGLFTCFSPHPLDRNSNIWRRWCSMKRMKSDAGNGTPWPKSKILALCEIPTFVGLKKRSIGRDAGACPMRRRRRRVAAQMVFRCALHLANRISPSRELKPYSFNGNGLD